MTGKQGLYDPAYEHDACGIGFVANIHGVRSRDIVEKSLQILVNLSHRSAVAADSCTGDGAGVLIQIPHAFLRRVCAPWGIALPDPGSYGVGMVFLPSSRAERAESMRLIESAVVAEGCTVLGWRDVPVDDGVLATATRRSRPVIRQIFVSTMGVARDLDADSAFEITLYVIRRRIESALRMMAGGSDCYIASLSSRTVVYKGMLTPVQLTTFYKDLSEPDLVSAIALVHSRFSTNTFPSWRLAHPYRFVAHNGEINTIRGNRNRMRAREALLESDLIPGDLSRLFPICTPDASDSATFDEVLELLHLGGRSLPHAVLMMVPEAWENHDTMDDQRKAFYQFHASMMEAWDGPACVTFTDGTVIGAVL